MKNKFCYILIGILFSFSFMNNVFAEGTLDFTVTTDVSATDVVVGDEVTVLVGVKSDTFIYSCEFAVTEDSTLKALTPNSVNNYKVDFGENSIVVEAPNTSGAAPVDGIGIMQLNYQVNGAGKLTIKTIECVSFDDEKTGTYEDVIINFTTKELSEDTTLKSVKINGQEISNFSPNKFYYNFLLDNPNFSLSYETANHDYQEKVVVKMNDTVITNLDNIAWSDPSGQKIATLELIVNDVTTYSIGVFYEAKDLDNTLKSLKINGEKVTLVSGQTKYTVKVGNDVNTVKVEAELNDDENFELAEPFVNGSRTHSFSGSSTEFTIEILPVNDQIGGSSLSYTIEVVKEGSTAPSSSSKSSSSSKPASSDVEKNPQTGNISMFIMALILISSLVGSVLLYQKNIESYK